MLLLLACKRLVPLCSFALFLASSGLDAIYPCFLMSIAYLDIIALTMAFPLLRLCDGYLAWSVLFVYDYSYTL